MSEAGVLPEEFALKIERDAARKVFTSLKIEEVRSE